MTEPRTDHQLITAAAAGDAASFDALVRRHTDRMYRVAVRIVGSRTEAEDVVQDAWVSAWRGLNRFRGDASASTWLYRVVTNAALAQLRRRRPTVSLDSVLADTDRLLTDRADGPESHALRGEQVSAVQRAIATLDPSQRVPLVLHELEGMSYADVAEVLQVPVPALHSRLHRARLALLTRLKELR